MSDYIERNALLYDIRIAKMLAFGILETKLVEDIIEQQPTADVVEVRHGHWIKDDNGTYSCSVCQSWIPNEQHYYANYCLHCGADMRGEKE